MRCSTIGRRRHKHLLDDAKTPATADLPQVAQDGFRVRMMKQLYVTLRGVRQVVHIGNKTGRWYTF